MDGCDGSELALGSRWAPTLAPVQWHARCDHALILVRDDLSPVVRTLILGGVSRGRVMQDVWHSSDAGATWECSTASAPWPARGGLAAAGLKSGRALVVGGTGGRGLHRDVWRSDDSAGRTWVHLREGPWLARYGHSLIAMDVAGTEVLVLLGGVGLRRYFNDVWRSPDGGETWEQAASNTPFAPRAATAAAATSSGFLLLAGGRGEDTYFADVWLSTDVGSTWSELTWEGISPLPLSGAALVPLQNDSFLLLGGFDGNKHLNQVWKVVVSHSRRDICWKNLPDPGWQPRYCHRAVLLERSVIILTGGYGIADGDFGDTWTSPSLPSLHREVLRLQLLGRGIQKKHQITSETWAGAVLPCLLPETLLESAKTVSQKVPAAEPAPQKDLRELFCLLCGVICMCGTETTARQKQWEPHNFSFHTERRQGCAAYSFGMLQLVLGMDCFTFQSFRHEHRSLSGSDLLLSV